MQKDRPSKSAFRTPRVAILLAAGLGKRQQPLTNQTPKPLLCAENRPLIDYAIDAVVYSGIKTVYVVTNYLEGQIIDHLTKNRKDRFELVCCHQNTTKGTANAVHAVQRHAQSIAGISNYVVISATDYVFSEGYIKALIDFHTAGSHDISVSLRGIDKKKAADSSRAELGADGRLKRINEKPANVEDDNNIVAATLLYIAPVEIFNFVSSANESIRGEYELADVINNMINSGYRASGLKQPSIIEPNFQPQGNRGDACDLNRN